MILAGQVRVNGQVVSKAGHPVAPDAEITLVEPDHPYVGRGGVKLAHALDVFGIDPRGRVALDVGHGQLAWTLRRDPRVFVIERVNARTLTADQLPPDAQAFDIITVDVSFIAARHVLPALAPLLVPNGDAVVLVKPQFEAGRDEVGKGGLVHDSAVHSRVIDEVTAAADALGLTRVAFAESPIRGAEGNREFFLHLRHG